MGESYRHSIHILHNDFSKNKQITNRSALFCLYDLGIWIMSNFTAIVFYTIKCFLLGNYKSAPPGMFVLFREMLNKYLLYISIWCTFDNFNV